MGSRVKTYGCFCYFCVQVLPNGPFMVSLLRYSLDLFLKICEVVTFARFCFMRDHDLFHLAWRCHHEFLWLMLSVQRPQNTDLAHKLRVLRTTPCPTDLIISDLELSNKNLATSSEIKEYQNAANHCSIIVLNNGTQPGVFSMTVCKRYIFTNTCDKTSTLKGASSSLKSLWEIHKLLS